MALRESALLPTIKCSLCGLQVEISMMGDHLCPGPSPELSPPPESTDKFNETAFHSPPPAPSQQHGRLPTPVDTAAANRAFMNRGQLTPISQAGESRSTSPLTPGLRRQGSDYFSTKPDGSARTPPSGSLRPGGYGGFGDQDFNNPPLSARSIGETLQEKMNSIIPGPFDTKPSEPRSPFPKRNESAGKMEGSPDLRSSSSQEFPGNNGPVAGFKQPKKSGYEGFGPPTPRDPDPNHGFLSRSETYPRLSPGQQTPRRPSFSNTQSSLLPPMGFAQNGRRPSMGPDTSRRPPPRTSLIPQDIKAGSVDLAAEFGASNPYHTPSDSTSSGYSMFSGQSQASSQSSISPSDSRGDVNHMLNTFQISERPRPKDLRIETHREIPFQHSSIPESPSNISPKDVRKETASQLDVGQEKKFQAYRPVASPRYDASAVTDRSPARTPSREAPTQRKADPASGSMPSRGDCKSCQQPITGKSISSADGRLTGKYHKACFVCTTCSSPFTSAEFYVLNDRPYCEMHYHKLNGSLCGGCGRGIEGQYVEDEARTKHHLNCFRCLDCGISLSGGYFEVDGKAFCERDALRRTQVSPVSPISPGGPMSGPPSPYPPGMRRPGPGPGPGSRHYGPPHGRPMGPGGPGPRPGYGPPGMHRGPYGGPSPNRLGPGMGQRPQMNKRMTRLGNM